MKYYVWKKVTIFLVRLLIFSNLIFATSTILLIFFEMELQFLLIMNIILLAVTHNIYVIYVMRYCGSIVLFEEAVVKCMYIRGVRKTLPYNEINDYGVFYFRTKYKFIYVSRVELTEVQKIGESLRSYIKADGVLILEYNHEAFEFLKTKIRSEILPCELE